MPRSPRRKREAGHLRSATNRDKRSHMPQDARVRGPLACDSNVGAARYVDGVTISSSRLPVFDDVSRDDVRPATHLESSLQFLNRAGGAYWDQVRALTQRWLDQVADDSGYRDLRARMRSDDAANYSAFFELYLHESRRRAGYEVSIHRMCPEPHVILTFVLRATERLSTSKQRCPAPRRLSTRVSNAVPPSWTPFRGCGTRTSSYR